MNGEEISETQAQFLSDCDWYAYTFNEQLVRLMSSEEMTAAVHIHCGKDQEWMFSPDVFYVCSASGQVSRFEKVQ